MVDLCIVALALPEKTLLDINGVIPFYQSVGVEFSV